MTERNQLIFLDIGVIVGIAAPMRSEAMQEIGVRVREWLEGDAKVLILPLADWEILDKRKEP